MPEGKAVIEKVTVPLSPLMEVVMTGEKVPVPWPITRVENWRGENTEKSWVRTWIATEW